jgi:hypothetical protein
VNQWGCTAHAPEAERTMTAEAPKPDLIGLLPEEAQAALREHFARRGQPAFR